MQNNTVTQHAMCFVGGLCLGPEPLGELYGCSVPFPPVRNFRAIWKVINCSHTFFFFF